MRLLLKSGADPALVDTDGRTARQLAERLADSVAAAKAADKQGGGGGEPARPPRDDAPDAATLDQILDLLDLAELVRPSPFLHPSLPPSLCSPPYFLSLSSFSQADVWESGSLSSSAPNAQARTSEQARSARVGTVPSLSFSPADPLAAAAGVRVCARGPNGGAPLPAAARRRRRCGPTGPRGRWRA